MTTTVCTRGESRAAYCKDNVKRVWFLVAELVVPELQAILTTGIIRDQTSIIEILVVFQCLFDESGRLVSVLGLKPERTGAQLTLCTATPDHSRAANRPLPASSR